MEFIHSIDITFTILLTFFILIDMYLLLHIINLKKEKLIINKNKIYKFLSLIIIINLFFNFIYEKTIQGLITNDIIFYYYNYNYAFNIFGIIFFPFAILLISIFTSTNKKIFINYIIQSAFINLFNIYNLISWYSDYILLNIQNNYYLNITQKRNYYITTYTPFIYSNIQYNEDKKYYELFYYILYFLLYFRYLYIIVNTILLPSLILLNSEEKNGIGFFKLYQVTDPNEDLSSLQEAILDNENSDDDYSSSSYETEDSEPEEEMVSDIDYDSDSSSNIIPNDISYNENNNQNNNDRELTAIICTEEDNIQSVERFDLRYEKYCLNLYDKCKIFNSDNKLKTVIFNLLLNIFYILITGSESILYLIKYIFNLDISDKYGQLEASVLVNISALFLVSLILINYIINYIKNNVSNRIRNSSLFYHSCKIFKGLLIIIGVILYLPSIYLVFLVYGYGKFLFYPLDINIYNSNKTLSESLTEQSLIYFKNNIL